MFGPSEYRPDPTEGITRVEDLPPPKIMVRRRNANDICVRTAGTVPIATNKSSELCMTWAI